MSTKTDNSTAVGAQQQGMLERIAMPFFLFSGALAVLLGTSLTFVLPRVLRIEIGGVERTATEIASYHAQLRANILHQEQEKANILAVGEPLFEALLDRKQSRPRISDVRQALLQLAASSDGSAIHVEHAVFEAQKNRVLLEGDVYGVGPHSMTVLASFVESIRRIPSVASVAEPRYTREESKERGVHSPFSLTITLR